MKVLILAARLDVPFKNFGPVSSIRGPIPPLRVHWANFVKSIAARHKLEGDEVTVLELPLWQFTTKDVQDIEPDLVYVPHKDMHTWPLGNEKWKTLFYHQTVFPWLFTVDPWGWGASMSIDIRPMMPPGKNYERLKAWADGNNSKFEQPAQSRVKMRGDFVFFVCQLPHDETIRLHSNVSVEEALVATLRWCDKKGKTFVAKEHPANIASMAPLKAAFDREKVNCNIKPWWLKADDCSIHDLLRDCEAVFCVNSGVGIEALLYEKPVFIFGSAEYEPVATKVSLDDLDAGWNSPKHSPETVRSWLETFYYMCYDTSAEVFNACDPLIWDNLNDPKLVQGSVRLP